VRVTVRGVEPSFIELKPKSVDVTIRIVDKQFKTLVSEPFLVKLERLESGSARLIYTREVRVAGEARVKLPIGTYKAILVPAGRDLYQVPRELVFMVEKPGTVTLELQPKSFTLTLKILDAWGAPLAGSRVFIARAGGPLVFEGETGGDGVLAVALPYGSYEVRVERRWFRESTLYVTLAGNTEEVARLEPSLIAYMLRYSPYIVGLTGLAAIVAVIAWARRVVEKRLSEEYF